VFISSWSTFIEALNSSWPTSIFFLAGNANLTLASTLLCWPPIYLSWPKSFLTHHSLDVPTWDQLQCHFHLRSTIRQSSNTSIMWQWLHKTAIIPHFRPWRAHYRTFCLIIFMKFCLWLWHAF
jgi:hypothetical protein